MLEEKRIDETNVSRRNFLVKAGALTAGMAVAGGIFGSIIGSAEAATWNLPFKKKLDLERVRKLGYDNYFKGACMYGAASALITALREANPGTDWDNVPEDMFKYGGGGIASWGTLCGALNGSLYVMALATNNNMGGVGNDLMSWYTKFPFPSTKLDYVETNELLKKQVTTVSNSPLCHASVSRWCSESGFGVNSTEKKHRCAKLTGDTAAKAAELLNKLLYYKNYVKSEKFAADTNFCMTCHAPDNINPGTTANTAYPKADGFPADSEQGKMVCGSCHDTNHVHATTFTEDLKDNCVICHK